MLVEGLDEVLQTRKRSGLRSAEIVGAVVAVLAVVFILIIANQLKTSTESRQSPRAATQLKPPGSTTPPPSSP